jgi:DNA-binding IclR family transcriptional regulator
MGWLGWIVTFLVLGLLALGVLALIGLRLWRSAKALGRDLARATELTANLGSARDLSEAP